LPVRWNLNPEYYGEWLLDWHRTIRSWNLEDFDYVLSDNLVEPLLYSERVTLCGSFLWHDVLSEAFPDNKFIARYSSWCKDLLAAAPPHMIANRYFVTPAVLEQANVHQVGLVPFCEARRAGRTNNLPRRVLIALGRAQSANGITDLLGRAASQMIANGMEVFAAEAIFQTLQTKCPGIQFRSFGDDSLETIDLAVIRGGLGTISDCIASKVPMLYVDDSSPEIRYNQKRLNEMGVAAPFEGFLNGDAEILTSPFVYKRTISRMNGFDLEGHLEAGDILAGLWNVLTSPTNFSLSPPTLIESR